MEGPLKKHCPAEEPLSIAEHVLSQPTILAVLAPLLQLKGVSRLARVTFTLHTALKRVYPPYAHVTALCAAGLARDSSFPVALCAGAMRECVLVARGALGNLTVGGGTIALQNACMNSLCRQGRIDLIECLRYHNEWAISDRRQMLELLECLACGMSPAVTARQALAFSFSRYDGITPMFRFERNENSPFYLVDLATFVFEIHQTRGIGWAGEFACWIARQNFEHYHIKFLAAVIEESIAYRADSNMALEFVEVANREPFLAAGGPRALEARLHLDSTECAPIERRIRDLVGRRLAEMNLPQ